MGSKVIKNSSYFSRYQTKFRRRREGKTDYVQRSSLIQQDRTKYGAPKYRLVARITNTKVIAQLIFSHSDHDEVVCHADSKELSRYGIVLGQANYASAYATGYLLGRRFLSEKNLLELVDQEASEDSGDGSGRRKFKAILDVGLARTTTGARVFAVMRGASDAGIEINHDSKRFARRKSADSGAAKKGKKDFESKGDDDGEGDDYFIYGGHVADYMKKLQSMDDKTAYQRQFSRYIKQGITADKIVGLYKAAIEKIRENPARVKCTDPVYKLKKPRDKKMSKEEKKELLNQKLRQRSLPTKP